MNARNAIYWITTIITALVFLSGGAVYLLGVEEPLEGMAALGYPAYFVTILGVWKILGGITILAPGLRRLKEWAYAGIAFDLSGAAFSHAAVGDPVVKAVVPLAFLGIAAGSWALRPPSRVLGVAAGEPSAARSMAPQGQEA